MTELAHFLDAYGPWLFLGLGFAEFAGLPIATVPLLVAAGGLAVTGMGPHPVVVAGLAALGAWVADAGWYGLGRARGGRLIDVACGLSSNPNTCIVGVCGRLERVGPGYIAISKFIPGVGNLIASAAGIARYPAARFLELDAAAVLVWAAAWVGLGAVFSGPVEAAVRMVVRYAGVAAVAALALIVLAVVWRFVRARLHGSHEGDLAVVRAEPEGQPGRAGRPDTTHPSL
jgi:membrane protein DedA with SNARE-associated domain